MNQLTKHLVDGILNEDKQEIIGIYAGGFKPPTAGHFSVVEEALNQYPEIDKLIVLVGSGIRDGIEQAESILVWEIYQNYLPMKVEIQATTKPPIGAVYSYAKNNPEDTIYWILGARDGNDEDLSDIASRTAAIDKTEDKYNNVEVKVITTSNKNMSGTNARKILLSGDKLAFFKFIPTIVDEKEEIFNILRPAVKETSNPDDGKAAPFGSGYKKLNEHSMGSLIDLETQINRLTQHMIDKGYNIEPLPSLEFIEDDQSNAEDFLGKTAYYNPNTQTIVLYTYGRHPKDIARSYAHEMIHHIQNLEGRLRDITTTNTQEDDYLNDIEAEANLKGTMTFRNWTDSLGENLNEGSQFGVLYHFTQELETVLSDDRLRAPISLTRSLDSYVTQWLGDQPYFIFDKDKLLTKYKITPFKDTSDNEEYEDISQYDEMEEVIKKDITNLARYTIKVVLPYPDKDWEDALKEKGIPYEIGKKLNEDGQETSDANMDDYKKQNNPSGKVKDPFGLNAYAYELALGLEEAIVGDKIECDNCDWSWDIKDGGDDLYICHECGHDNTPQLNEGIYDSLVTRLTNITIKKWVSDFKSNPKIKQSFVDIDIDEEDSKGREIEFNYVGQLKFDKKIGGYEVDGTSNSGEEDDKYAFIATLFKVNPEVLPNAWSKISADVSDVIRHEIEHLTQAGDNVRSGKYKDDDIQIRDMINKLKILPYKNYYLLDKEVDAMLQGLYLKAKKTKKPFADVVNNYLDVAPGLEDKKDREMIINLWRSRRKSLSLPVFENKKEVMDYKIHLDMDGVITDFDKQFKELTGMMPNEFELKYGIKDFWEAIDKAGVGFWRGMKWMPDGQELYNKVSQFDHELLSSPSRGESSKIGKRLWRRDKTPNTKLTLAYSANKKNYAAPNHILIDDRASNINQWEDAGGIGILHTSAASTIAKLKKLGL